MRLVIMCMAVASSLTFAQQINSGAVNGTVTDSSGAAIPGVKVTATSPALQGEQVFTTNEQGSYRFPALPLGVYKFTYEAQGFASVVRDKVDVTLNFAATINVVMTPATQQQTVVVTGETPLVDTQNTAITAGFSTKQLQDVPTGRDMWSIIGLTPGMHNQTLDVGGSAVGNQVTYSSYGYGGNNRVMIDGINTSEGTSGAGFYFDYGSFTEFNVGTAGNDASMPVPGNAINAVIKTGGNQFHGTVYFDYESPNFQGTNVDNTLLAQGVGQGQRLARYYDINGDVGGPIIRDRLWFYTSIRDQANGKTVTGFPVQKPGSVNSYAYDRNATYKISGAINQNHRLSNYIQWNPILKPQRNSQAGYYEDAMYYQKAVAWVGNVQYTGVYGPKLVTTVLLGTWGYNFPQVPYGVFPGDPGTPECPNCAPNLPKVPVGTIGPRMTDLASGNTAGGQAPSRTNPRRYQFEPTGSYFLDNFLHSNHQLKFGWVTERESGRDETYASVGGVTEQFQSTGLPDFSTPYRVQVTNSPRVAYNYLMHHGAYLQDQLKIHQRLTLNIGVRWDYYKSYYGDEKLRPDCIFCDYFYRGIPLPNGAKLAPTPYANGDIPGATVNTFPHDIAPRIGIAYDLTGKGRTILNLNWGQFYANAARNIAAAANPLQAATATFTWNNPNNLPFALNQLGPIVGTPSIAQANTIDPKLRDPRFDDMGAIVQHQLSNTLSIRGGFVYRKMHHDFELVNLAVPASLFSLPVTVQVPGLNYGINGNKTDFTTMTLWDIPTGQVPAASANQLTTPDGNNAIYRNWEFTINKRMSNRFTFVGNFFWTRTTNEIGGGGATSCSSCGNGAISSTGGINNGVPTNPNQLINSHQSYTDWTAHVDGTYEAPWGFRITPTVRMQQGAALTEVAPISATRLDPKDPARVNLNMGTIYLPIAPTGKFRSPDLYLFDTRVERQFAFKERFKLNAFFDAFNIFNSNAANANGSVVGVGTVSGTGTSLDGQQYQKFLAATTVLPPRVFRMGVRFQF